MTSTVAATLLVSLRRMRAAWPIVLAAGLTCLMASSLLAAGPIYANAVSIAGLHRALADAPVDQANIEVSLRSTPERADAIDAIVTAEINAALQGIGGSILRSARSNTFDLPTTTPGPVPDLVEIGFDEGLSDRATLIAGTWPAPGAPASTEAVPVAVAAYVAEPLGLAVGDVLALESRLQSGFSVPVRIACIFTVDDPRAPAWWDEGQVLDGLVRSDGFALHGPLFADRRALLERATLTRSELVWRAFPAATALSADGIEQLRTRVGDLDRRLEAALDDVPVTVTTAIPEILTRAERSLLVSRTGVLLLIVQLAVIAGYAALLSAALLVEHRRVDTAMLRSRGAGPVRIGAMSLVEGLCLTIPAALLGPWIAAAALSLFNVVGPLADIGLTIEPQISVEAYVAAGAAALGCLVALLLPALPTRRSFAAVQSDVSRAGTRPAGQRLGLDIALVAVAAIGVWQLRHYGAPLTRSIQGSVGIDPLLVATPAIGLLAGAVVALRLLPLLAGVIERATARGRGLVSALGARQLARRPLRYTRAALLLTLAMAMGVFAVSYAWTWTASQRDQAAFQVGAEVRAHPGSRSVDPPRWALDQAYAAIPGVDARMPVDRTPVRASRSENGEIVALDAAAAPSLVIMRPDLASAPLSSLMAPLAAARPTLEAVVLPAGTRQLRLAVEPHVRVDPARPDGETGDAASGPVDPAAAADRAGLTTTVVIRDLTGLLYRFSGAVGMLGGGRQHLAVPLGDADEAAFGFAEPLELVSLELGVSLQAGMELRDATITIDGLEAGPAGGAWAAVPLDLATGWRLTSSVYGLPHETVETQLRGDGLTARTGSAGLASIRGVDQYGRGTTLTFAPAALSAIASAPIPAIATTAFLEASGRLVGESTPVEISGVRRMVAIVGAADGFPTVDPATPALIVDLPTLALARFEGSDAVDPASEWWFAVDPADRAGVVTHLEGAAIDSRSVLTIDGRERALASDPVALGIIGALAIGFVAAALFAVVGFIVSAAVSARERVTEFALLRALGLSSGQLSSWLSLENAVLAAVSLAAGTLLGLLMAWIVLPFVTVTQEAGTPYPPVDVAIPWPTIAVLEIVAIVALASTVLMLAWPLRRIGLSSTLRMGED